MDRPTRPAQSGASGNKEQPRAQRDRTQNMTQEDVRAIPNIITCML